MILELRTLQLKIAAGPSVAEAYAKVMPARTRLSPLAGFFQSEVGTLNQLIGLWPYNSLADRDTVAAREAELEGWPPDAGGQVLENDVRLLDPLPFSPP